MKVAVIYTGTTPELIDLVDSKLSSEFAGKEIEVVSYKNPEIINEAKVLGYVSEKGNMALLDLYQEAVKDGADVLLNACSSVGDMAKEAKKMYELTGIKFVRIDELMAFEAVKNAKRIGVVATLKSTLEPTKRLVQECADILGKEIVLVDALADGAFGLNPEEFKNRLIYEGKKVVDKVDALLFAQGSMAYAEEDVSVALGIPVYSSVKYGAKEVASRVLEN